jgi:hypothetical protein
LIVAVQALLPASIPANEGSFSNDCTHVVVGPAGGGLVVEELVARHKQAELLREGESLHFVAYSVNDVVAALLPWV